jgi:hypothetical protein
VADHAILDMPARTSSTCNASRTFWSGGSGPPMIGGLECLAVHQVMPTYSAFFFA